MLRLLVPFLLAAFLSGPTRAQAGVPIEGTADDPSPHSDAALVSSVASVQPGVPFDVALRLTMDPEWHSYWINPGDSGMPTSLAWDLPEGFEAGDIRWPFPERIDLPPLTSYGYSDEVVLFTTITPPADLPAGEVTLSADAEWLICAEVCLPAAQSVSLTLPVGPTEAGPDLLAEARRLLPAASAEGWTFRASPTSAGYALHLMPPAGFSGSLEGAQFFALAPGTIQHPAQQPVAREGDAFTLALERSEFAAEPATELAGVLVAPEGTAWADGRRAVEIRVPIGEAQVAAAGAGGTSLSLLVALGLALVGGLILNLMPCVFPILSIKILGFAEGRTHERATLRKHGLLFGAGVVVSFWALAGLLLAVRAGGEAAGWGFQLQQPPVVAALALLMFAVGLNLAGVFEVGARLAGATGQLDRKGGAKGAFFSGVLATLVATPCTAPFMGAALGWALAQPALAALAVFTALGVGMALPYVLLSWFPAWLDRLPRPGQWMETLRHALAFPLFLTAVWLVWVFGRQTGVDGAALLLVAMTALAFAAWTFGRAASVSPRRLVPRTVAALALVLAVLAALAGSRRTAEAAPLADGWQPFDAAEVDALVASGEPVFVDFTAAWCLSCQVNKRVALDTRAVVAAFERGGVTRVRADWTDRDPAIADAIAAFGRSGVPLYVFYPGDGAAPVLLPEVLTPGVVLDALGG